MRESKIYIIQTNMSIDKKGKAIDFQSMIYGYSESWNDFKTYLLSSEKDTEKLVNGTMIGYTKPHDSQLEEVLINDDYHIEAIIKNGYGDRFNSKYYLITKERFDMFAKYNSN